MYIWLRYAISRTTKRTKSKASNDDDDSVSIDVDDRTSRFPIDFRIYKIFDGIEFSGKIIGYDSKSRLYQIEYSDGDQEEMFHNEVYAHKLKKPGTYAKKSVTKLFSKLSSGAKSSAKSSAKSNILSRNKSSVTPKSFPNIKSSTRITGSRIKPVARLQRRKDIRRKHRTRKFHRENQRLQASAATNALLISHRMFIAKLAPAEDDFDELEYELTIDDIRAITKLKNNHRELDMSEASISTEMIQVIISTIGSDYITPEEQTLGFYTRKKLKKLTTWNE